MLKMDEGRSNTLESPGFSVTHISSVRFSVYTSNLT